MGSVQLQQDSITVIVPSHLQSKYIINSVLTEHTKILLRVMITLEATNELCQNFYYCFHTLNNCKTSETQMKTPFVNETKRIVKDSSSPESKLKETREQKRKE